METVYVNGNLTMEDVNKFNETLPKIIEISSTKGQDIEVLSKLNPKIMIKITGGLDSKNYPKFGRSNYLERTLYTPGEVCEIIKSFEDIEKGIDASWTDLEASLYTYVELIKKIEHVDESKSDNERVRKNLLGITTGKALSPGFALIYKEAMDRLGIPCRYIDRGDSHAWNEIMIDGEYYPLDLAWDSIYYRSKESQGEIGICNFLTDKEFYFRPNHETDQLSEEDQKKIRALDIEKVQKAYENISTKTLSSAIIEKPVITIKSKELSGIFKNNEISSDTVEDVSKVKISVSDSDFVSLRSDIEQIGRYYPSLLRDIELENVTGSAINMQEVIDEVYSVRKGYEKTSENKSPISVTISSSFAEDFDLDFSNAPAVSYNASNPIDGVTKQKIAFRNLASTSIKIPSLSGKISQNISEISVDGFDLQDLDISGTNVRKLTIESELTENISSINGINEVTDVDLKTVTAAEFNRFVSQIFSTTSNIHDLRVENQDFHDRRILEELAINPNLARLQLVNSRVNNLEGLEMFDGRLGLLGLWQNDLQVSDLDRLNAFAENNPYLEMYLNSNAQIRNAIQSAPQISDDSHRVMSDWFYSNGVTNSRLNKLDVVDRLLGAFSTVPYYVKDAEIIRGNLRISKNPMMLENDDEIDTVNFNESYLQGGTLLLTVGQVERLLLSGKTIPQNVRIKIKDVTELTSQKARELFREMNNKGMNLSGVQIFDENGDNGRTQIEPYSLSQYVYIRDTLDIITSGIGNTEPDLDKFTTIYQRLMDSIDYDTPATKHDDAPGTLYYAEKLNSSRNLLEGLEEGKCVCAGYSDILRNALALVGIRSRINSGLAWARRQNSGHAWNQVQLDDGNGNKKWYYTDLTWDAGNGRYDYTLLGKDNFTNGSHDLTKTKDIENVEKDDYDRLAVREAFSRARNRSFDFTVTQPPIDIPENPEVTAEILDQNRITAEYKRRKNDMYAKFYGDKDYEAEYAERNRRYREHEIETTENSITFRTVEDYPEREADEEFLLLDKYRESLERMSKYEAGDTSVYQGTPDQIRDALERDKEYVETRNHTFNQHKNTQKDLATLGKYGEKVPYIPKQPGVLRNIVRAVGNVGIFTRNLVSPIYRGIGKYVAQPIHRLITNGRDASPYKNNWYHRMVARRDYFEEMNANQNPGHPIINAIKSRVDAFTKAKEGNEAVLRAGAADIRDNIVSQEREKALIQNLTLRSSRFDTQIQQLEQEIINRPNAANISDVRIALQNKIAERDRINNLLDLVKNNGQGTEQTDAISDKQHAIASKEVNTMRVTVIKGVAKGVAVKYVGPKIHEWLLERGKITRPIEVTTEVPETKQRWVETTYKNETVPVFEEAVDTSKNMSDIIGANEGKSITGFYSVYGGERGAATYNLTGNEKITAIFQADGLRGSGLSDKVGLTAPTLTDGTFASDLLDVNGVLNQDVTLDQIIEALNTPNIDMEAFSDVYVSVGDRYWTKLSDLVKDLTTQVQVGEEIKQVIDVAGHYEDYTEMVKKVIQTTEVVTNPAVKKAADIGSKVGKVAVGMDGILDVAENLRKTTTDTKSNKRNPRRYDFDEEVDDIPTSKKDYKRKVEERERE